MGYKSISEVVAYAKKRALEHHKYKNSGKHSWKTTVNCTWFAANCYKDCGYTDVHKRMVNGKYYAHPWAKQNLGPWLKIKVASGKELKASQLKPGDIIVKKTRKANVYHSGIYVGDGKVAEAVGSGTRLGPLKGRHYIMAFRIPDKSKQVKTVEHKATYQTLVARNVKKSYTSKSELIVKIPKGAEFKATKKHGNWVYGKTSIKGWICIKSDGKKHCKKI